MRTDRGLDRGLDWGQMGRHRTWEVSVLRSGNMAKESASVTAFLAVFVMPLTNEPNCRKSRGQAWR